MQINLSRIDPSAKATFWASLINPFMVVPGRHRLRVVMGLFIASIVELIGLAAIIPLLALVSFGPNTSAHMGTMKSAINDSFHAFLGLFGFSADITTLILLVVIGLSIKSAISILVMRYIGDLMADITTSVRLTIIRSLLGATWSFFSSQTLSRLVNGVGAEAGAIGERFLCAATILALFMQIVVYLIVSVMVSWKLSILAAIIALVMFGTFGKLVSVTRQAAKMHSRQMRRMAASFTDTILGMKPIKAMGRQARFAALFEADAKKLHKAMRAKVVSSEFASELQEPIIAGLLCIGLYVATTQWGLQLHQQMVVGLVLIRFTGVFTQMQRSFQRLISLHDMYLSVGALLHDARAAMETLTGREKPVFEQALTFDGLTFAYPGRSEIFSQTNWILPAHQLTTLMGPSGVGKSTMIDIIMGLREPSAGAVLVDGRNLQQLDIISWRHLIGYVPQEVVLFNESIFNNVTLGELDIAEADVIAALKAAGAMSFVEKLPGSLSYSVGERGNRLSGGQRQRIAIARALVRRPALLILDEATSGLDQEIERDICHSIKDLCASHKITVLAISHHSIWGEISDNVFEIRDHGVHRLEQYATTSET